MAKFIAPTTRAAIRPKEPKLPPPNLRQKFEISALIRDKADPTAEINAILSTIPGRPLIDGEKNHVGQLAGYEKTLRKLIEKDNPEAIKLGQEFGYCATEIEEADEIHEAPIDQEEVDALRVVEPLTPDGMRRKK